MPTLIVKYYLFDIFSQIKISIVLKVTQLTYVTWLDFYELVYKLIDNNLIVDEIIYEILDVVGNFLDIWELALFSFYINKKSNNSVQIFSLTVV